MRRIEVSHLRAQEKVSAGRLRIEKVAGDCNTADAMTKYVDGDGIDRHMAAVGSSAAPGRHRLAPETVEDV